MKNIKLVIEYDGHNYAGWQRQENAVTIQQVLEDALEKLTGKKTPVIGSGRTDSGVHARGQTANFFTDASVPPERYSYALNAILPRDIRIKHSEEVPADFHARYSAIGKTYRYSMVLSPHGVAIGRHYYCHIPFPLDVKAMKEAAEEFRGTHDFAAFMASGSSVKTTVRTVFDARLEEEGDFLHFWVTADGFLYNMVRIMAGTLIDAGRGKISSYCIKDIIISKDRSLAGFTAPAHGLCLERVYYKNLPENMV
ncbi:MAG: tRNA pseudouridine(38-40) synthase TruA [Caldicoprobacterales bacterium]|jgi:tRNA pseudouridine38-40 synthase